MNHFKYKFTFSTRRKSHLKWNHTFYEDCHISFDLKIKLPTVEFIIKLINVLRESKALK